MTFNPQPKQGKRKKRPPAGRLAGKALHDQNRAILERDGHLCACCRRPVPYMAESWQAQNDWPIHHVVYQGHIKKDFMILKMTVCCECHNNLHVHRVWDPKKLEYVPMGSKEETQGWCCARIINICLGLI